MQIIGKTKIKYGQYIPKDTGIDFPRYPHPKSTGLGVCRPAAAAVPADEVGLGQEEEREEEEEWKPRGAVGLPLPRRCMWRGRPGPTPPLCAMPRQRGTAVVSLHVARGKGYLPCHAGWRGQRGHPVKKNPGVNFINNF
jgi:hypothetical protein